MCRRWYDILVKGVIQGTTWLNNRNVRFVCTAGLNNVDVDIVELLLQKEEASTTHFRYILVYGIFRLEQIYKQRQSYSICNFALGNRVSVISAGNHYSTFRLFHKKNHSIVI